MGTRGSVGGYGSTAAVDTDGHARTRQAQPPHLLYMLSLLLGTACLPMPAVRRWRCASCPAWHTSMPAWLQRALQACMAVQVRMGRSGGGGSVAGQVVAHSNHDRRGAAGRTLTGKSGVSIV